MGKDKIDPMWDRGVGLMGNYAYMNGLTVIVVAHNVTYIHHHQINPNRRDIATRV